MASSRIQVTPVDHLTVLCPHCGQPSGLTCKPSGVAHAARISAARERRSRESGIDAVLASCPPHAIPSLSLLHDTHFIHVATYRGGWTICPKPSGRGITLSESVRSWLTANGLAYGTRNKAITISEWGREVFAEMARRSQRAA